MQNLTRNTLILLAASLVLVPGASAQGLVDLSAAADITAKADVDASGAFRAVDRAKAEAEAARGELESKAGALRADAEAKAAATLEQTEAQAEAGAQMSVSFGERAAAKVQQAIEAVKEFASSIAARASVSVDAGLEG